MLADLLKAAVVTIALGLPVFAWGDEIPERWWKLPVLVAGLAASMAAGVATFARKHRARIVPLVSVYVVVMLALLLYLAFVIEWRRGNIEF